MNTKLYSRASRAASILNNPGAFTNNAFQSND